jgi:hypothetical protein
MNIPTCFRCPKRFAGYIGDPWRQVPTCTRLVGKLASVKGLGLTVIKFACKERDSLLSPGDEISFSLPVEWGLEGDSRSKKMEGVIMRRIGRKWLVYSADEDINRNVCKLYPDLIKKTGGVKRLCTHCGLPEGVERPVMESGNWSCRTGYKSQEDLPCEFADAS